MSYNYNQTYKHKSDTFEGSIKKIILESDFFECLYPEDSLIRKQRLTLHLYDKTSLTTYYFPSDDKEKSNAKTMRRFKFKYTDKLMYYISHHFTEPHNYDSSNSIGTWKIQLTNTDNVIWYFSGPLGESIFSYDFELSGLARRTLVMPQLLVFDGNGYDLVLDSSTKNFNIYYDRAFTGDSDLDIGVPILCVEEKSTNNFYFCNSDTTFAYWDYLEHRSVTEPKLERMIASQSPY